MDKKNGNNNKHGVTFPLPEDVKKLAAFSVTQAYSEPDNKGSADLIVEVIQKITDHGLDYLYLYPLDLAQVGIIGKNTVRFGVNTAKKGINIAVKSIIGTLRGDKLKAIASFIESIII